MYIINFLNSLEYWVKINYNNIKESTHSKSGCSTLNVKCPYGHRPSCVLTGWAFYFRLFLLSRKAIIATSKLPKDIINANIPIKIDRTSYAPGFNFTIYVCFFQSYKPLFYTH